MSAPDPDDGWHFGVAGEQVRGFLVGTAFQPDETRDHLDAWGTPHPDNLKDCAECRAASTL